VYPATTSWSSAPDACSDRPIVGIATLTIVTSRSAMNCPASSTTSISHDAPAARSAAASAVLISRVEVMIQASGRSPVTGESRRIMVLRLPPTENVGGAR